jgi:glycosyltransferase involved in cell wall biosynthesis
MPELIEDGITGFLVDSVEEAVEAIDRIDEIDRAVVRRAVIERFTIDRMADAYLDLYRHIIDSGERKPRASHMLSLNVGA